MLRLHPRLAPYKVAVLPLSKKDTLTPLAREVLAARSQPRYMVDYDETQAIGRRYRRQDEIGTPLCVTVDFDSLDDHAVTVRDRDTTEQERVPIDDLLSRSARSAGLIASIAGRWRWSDRRAVARSSLRPVRRARRVRGNEGCSRPPSPRQQRPPYVPPVDEAVVARTGADCGHGRRLVRAQPHLVGRARRRRTSVPTSTASTAFWQVATPLRAYEVEEAGDVAGLDLVHLQCHFGIDTLGWARLGARVVGVDLSASRRSPPRRELAARAGLDAEFVVANVYDAPTTLRGRTFDRVYTGIGALCWLPGHRRVGAASSTALLRPGGSPAPRRVPPGHPLVPRARPTSR